MFFDWLAREGVLIINWWFLVTLAGAATLPLTFRLLRGLPDRGYFLARALGLLLIGFVFWLLTMFGFTQNNASGMAVAYVVVVVIGIASYLGIKPAADDEREPFDLRLWWREHRAAIVVGEVLFIVALFAWATYKAYQPDAFTTEKPMELAFLSGVMRSQAFPPNDPWFSGYAISYYYFGYVIAAMLSTLSGVSSGIGFSLLNALLFALTALSVYGVVYNLVRSRSMRVPPPDALPTAPEPRSGSGAAISTALLGVVFVLLLSNFILPLVEVPYQTNTASAEYLAIWNVNQREEPLGFEREGDIGSWQYWWWFRSARAISDRALNGVHSEVIDEFPAFSFILSDNHPHVLALPFAAMTIGLALNVVLRRRRPNLQETLLYGVVIGGLIFLNTWDGAIYLILMAGAEALRRLLRGGTGRLTTGDWVGTVLFGAALLIIGVIIDIPFLVSFRSQLGGVLPNLVNPTIFNQFFLMFGPFLLLLLPYLVVEWWRAQDRANLRYGLTLAGGILLGLTFILLVMTVISALVPNTQNVFNQFVVENGGMPSALIGALAKRITHLPTALLLTLLLALAAARLFPKQELIADDRQVITTPSATAFVLLLIALGAALTLAPEFVYLRDNFGTRMNTVFKFYYQTWLLWGIASAYAVYSILGDVRLPKPSPTLRAVYGGVVALVLVMGLPYIVLAVYARTQLETGRVNSLSPAAPTLNGVASYLSYGGITPDDEAALACLSDRVAGDSALVVQAVGNSYEGAFGTVGTLTGIPLLFNWYGHQSQWRGQSELPLMVGSRVADIDTLYSDPTWNATRNILANYGIDYIFIGATERNQYGEPLIAAEVKFRDNLEMVCEYGTTRVYHVPESALVLNTFGG